MPTVDGQSLVEMVEESLGDESRVEGLLCGAVKHLRNNKTRPDSGICYGLLYLAKTKPFIFQKDIITEVNSILKTLKIFLCDQLALASFNYKFTKPRD